MPDVFTKAKRSEVMSRIRSRGNKETELALARLLRAHKISGWRRHVLLQVTGDKRQETRKHAGPSSIRHPPPSSVSAVPVFRVRPDFVFHQARLAVFVDGCFWHGCPRHSNLPASNRAFWKRKLTGNVARDRLVTRVLRRAGWRVLRIWEHELSRKNQARCCARLRRFLGGLTTK